MLGIFFQFFAYLSFSMSMGLGNLFGTKLAESYKGMTKKLNIWLLKNLKRSLTLGERIN